MDVNGNKIIEKEGPQLFDRVVSILEQARKNVVRSVNSNMVIAHWLIGREIVEEIQAGDERAEYGKRILGRLSEQLSTKYGTGFSVSNLRNFRQFYSIYQGRSIHYPSGSKLQDDPKHYPEGSESHVPAKYHPASDPFLIDLKIGKLTHADVGQMDGYVRLFEDRFKVEGDNPTIGLILCSDKGEAVVRYSVLKESKQIFASK